MPVLRGKAAEGAKELSARRAKYNTFDGPDCTLLLETSRFIKFPEVDFLMQLDT